MAESSGVFPEVFNLGEHLIRGTGKDVPTGHLLIQPRSQREASAAACAAHNLGRYRWWMIARRITPVLRHFVGRHVPEHFFRPGTGLLGILTNVDQRGIGQAVEWRLLAMGRAVGGTIAVVDLANARVPSQKHGPGIFVLGHRDSAPATTDCNPDGRVWLLVRTWPDIDLPRMKPAAFKVKWPIVGGPGLDDHIMCFPQPLHPTERQHIGRCSFIRYTAHKPALQPTA